jgi:hypothetical protein
MQPDVDFSYTIFWTKQVLQWSPERRATMQAALAQVLTSPDFINNAYERRFTVPGLDDSAHAGASLLALDKVLTAFKETE